MYVITVYGFENRAATRIQVGCQSVALITAAAAQELYPMVRIDRADSIDRSSSEEARAERLKDQLAPLIFGEGRS